jgi:hypothetical protein
LGLAVFEGWTFAAARGASRRTLFEMAEAWQVGPAILEQVERARDVSINNGPVDAAALERLVELYAVQGFHVLPRTLFQAACVKRVQ